MAKKATKKDKIDELVNKAMNNAGDGLAVSVLRTAHEIKGNKEFLKLLGLKSWQEPVRIKGRQASGFDKIREVVRESMVRMYGPLRKVN